METINLYGAGGHAKVVRDIISAQGDTVDKLYDDNPSIITFQGLKVEQPLNIAESEKLIITVGDNQTRKNIADKTCCHFSKAIHPGAVVSPSATIGEGSVVMPGVVIQAHSSIGRHCIINSSSSIDHDCQIGDFCHISPGAILCGDVGIGEGTWIGAGAVVIQGIKIGTGCIIGAGSVVLSDIPDNVKAFGNPCKIKEEL